MGSSQYPRYTDARKGKAVGRSKSTTDDNDSTTRLKHFVEHLHGSGAGSLRPQIYEATTEHGDKNTFRNQQGIPTGSPTGDPAGDSAGEPREAAPTTRSK